MRIITVNTITEFCEYLGLANLGKIIESDLETEENECDKYKRKLRDAEVLCTVAANADGDCLDLGTSHGRSAYRIATNLQNNLKVYTVNLLPEQFDASSGLKVTHLLSKEEIGSYFKNRNIENVQQIYANTTKWNIPDEIDNISVCYVDAAHDTELVYNDSRKMYPRIKNDGFICWHDFNPELRNKFDWIDSAMRGVEWFIEEYSPDGEIVHLKDSWIGVYRKQKVCPSHSVGLVLDREFHELNKWVSATTPYLVNRILQQFECSIITSQAEYEAILPRVDVILSMEPGWAAPVLDFNRTKAIKDEFNKKSSFILYSDPHKDKWREDYFLTNHFDYILAYYDAPTKYHFRKTPHNRILHFPWCVPDHWITHNQIECKGQKSIAIFGAQHHDAYTVRNWCRNFPFVENNSFSGVENKVLSGEEYILKLQSYDAAIAAGSDAQEYRLTMPKYFEIPATGALLFAQKTDDLGELGFRHMENCLFFTQDDFEKIAKEYLRNPHNYQQIRTAGRELIRKRHSLSKRMNDLSEYIVKALDTKRTGTYEGIATHFDTLGSSLCNSTKEEAEIYKNNDTQSLADGDVVSKTNDMFTKYFEMICVPELLPKAHMLPFSWQNKPLEWEVCHELLAFQAFCGEEVKVSTLIELSNNRYKLLDDLWPGDNPSAEQLDHFYIESAKVLPWGHGVFQADHNVIERRSHWLRRVNLLLMLESLGVKSLVDYGAGGGHTTLLACAMGFEKIIHHDYGVFHPYVRWRADQVLGPVKSRQQFILSNAQETMNQDCSVDAVICTDVVEHVFDPNQLLIEIQRALKPGGYLVWVSMFEQNINCHLHGSLKGKEEALLSGYGFERISALPVSYQGHSGLYRLHKALLPITLEIPESQAANLTPRIIGKDNSAVIVQVGSIIFNLNPDRYLDNEIINGRLFEEASVLKLIDIIKPGMVVLDVGANFGYYTLLFSKWVGPSGKVIAFEPTQEYCRRLNGHLLRNKAENVAVVNKGLSKTAEEVEINIGECSATLHWSCDFDPRIKEKISLVTLDEWWQEYVDNGNPDRLDFIKIDTDGHEPHFLLGALKTITRLRPIIHLEFSKPHYENGGFSCTQVADWLDVQLGYTLYQEDGNPFESHEALLQKIEDPKISANILCFPRCIADENGKNTESAVASVFKSPEAIYLASADRMDLVLANLQSLKKLHTKVDTYASVVGGLSGLNYLIDVTPAQIVLFDINPDMLKYAELVLELIRISVSPKEFISRVFSRSVDHFLEATGEPDLNIDNQNLYLSQPVQAQIRLDTLSKLSLSARDTYNETLNNYLSGQLSDGARNCRRLLPCWPIGRRVPVGGGQAEGYNEEGKLEPNTNTFFYGYGWLGSTAAYTHIKDLLLTTPVRLSVIDLIKTDLASIFDLSKNCMIHISNIDDWFMDDWKERLALWESQVSKTAGRLIVISSHNGISIIQPDPHMRAYAAIQPFVTGKVVEITHKIPWGFDEFDRINVTVEQYLANEYPADTTILHILIGEGISRDIFTSVYKRAIARSNKVIILEHNRLSMDWHNTESLNFVSSDELRKLLGIDDHETPVSLLDFQKVGGIADDARNILFVVGKPTVPQKRIKVLICYDEEGWAWWYRANNIKTNISTSIDIDILKIGSSFDYHKYDLVVLFEAYLYEQIANVPPEKVIVGSSTLKTLYSAITRYSQLNFAGFLVNNLESYNKVAHLNNVYCCQNGVSEVLFSFKPNRSQEIAACWVGNNASMNNKGLDIIREACQRAGVKLLALDQSENVYKGKVLTQEQVRDEVYHKASFYICASEMEGTPNPALESLACGLPVISTRVGNMPEIIVDGYNGYLVERNVAAIAEAIEKLKHADLVQLSQNARQSILNGWTWKQQTAKYEVMFRTIAAQGPVAGAGDYSGSRPFGYSFCIITNGKRLAKLRAELDSIRALAIPHYEILIAGELPPGMATDGFNFYPLPDAAHNGRLGEMRNLLCAKARYNHLIVCDDDLLFQEDFYKGLVRFGEDYDVLCVKFLNADGTRYWSWATVGGPRGQVLLDYHETDPFLYVTGGLCIMKSWVADKVKWDSVRGMNQMEDVDFSRKLQAAGIRIDLCLEATVIHDDWRITQTGDQVFRIDVDLEKVADYFFSRSWDEGMQLVSRVFKTFPGNSELKQRLNALAAKYRPAVAEVQNPLALSGQRNGWGRAFAAVQHAVAAINAGDMGTAFNDLQDAVAHAEGDADTLISIGILMLGLGRYDAAKELFGAVAGTGAEPAELAQYLHFATSGSTGSGPQLPQAWLDTAMRSFANLEFKALNIPVDIVPNLLAGAKAEEQSNLLAGVKVEEQSNRAMMLRNYRDALAKIGKATPFTQTLHDKVAFLESSLGLASAKTMPPISLRTSVQVGDHRISRLCRQEDFETDWYRQMCRELGIPPDHYERKNWEYYFVARGLQEEGLLEASRMGLGFGVGKEKLIPYFAKRGCAVLATDLEPDNAAKKAWVDTNQHSDSVKDVFLPGICDYETFSRQVQFAYVDMNRIPEQLQREEFDFTWSCCAFEHVGSIEQGKQFILNQMKCLKPGGVALHTTEFNLSSDELTVSSGPTVIFRKCDIEELAEALRKEGHEITVSYDAGTGELDRYVDIPPYMSAPDKRHLRLLLWKYITTSIGLFIRKKI